METLKTLAALREWRAKQKGSVGFIPTMGALHDGHLSLVERAKAENDTVIVSIFVNPTQFAPHEDYDTYPRELTSDKAKLEAAGASAVWAPTPLEMYPEDFVTSVTVGGSVTSVLEGAFRPHHFGGVATVVAKLFGQVSPTNAYFGEKDYQQLMVITRMAQDLSIPTKVLGCPIYRDADGLALSSRNAYLSDEHLVIAKKLNRILKEAIANTKTMSIKDAENRANDDLLIAGFHKIDYVVIRDAEDLSEVEDGTKRPLRILAAAWLGNTRLIDNMAV